MVEYFENATVHGITKIHSSKTKHGRLFWILVFLIFIGIFFVLLHLRVKKYFSYDVRIMSTQVDNIGAMEFPVVAFCNTNRFSMKTVREIIRDNRELIRDINSSYSSNETVCKSLQNLLITENYFSPLDNLFVDKTCSFNDLKNSCSRENFTEFSFYSHGTCFAFNFDGGAIQVTPGSHYGLKFVVDIEENEYFPCDFLVNYEPTGILISIYHPKSSPNLNDVLVASPGKITRIGLTRTFIKRLKTPYEDDCRGLYDVTRDEYPIITHETYSVYQCKLTCLIFKMNETCGGIDPESTSYVMMKLRKSFPLLPKDDHCIKSFLAKYSKGLIKCHCRNLCEEYDYETKLNTGKWPAKVTLDGWIRTISEHKNKSIDESYIKNNIVAVAVYYDDFRTTKTIHFPDYSFETFLADVGGISGLFIGASVFSFVEVLVVAIESLLLKFTKCSKSESKNRIG